MGVAPAGGVSFGKIVLKIGARSCLKLLMRDFTRHPILIGAQPDHER